MKLRYTIFVVLGVLLGSSLYSGTVIALDPPNTSFKTGDNFYFNTTETRNDNWLHTVALANDLDPTQLYRYEERYQANDETTEGDLDLFLIKPDANLPDFTSPEGNFDHIIMVDWSGMTVNPSTSSWYENFYDLGAGGIWQNTSLQTEDTTGRYYSSEDDNNDGGDERAMPLVSNATYIVLMSEMTENSVDLDVMQWFGQDLPLGSFDSSLQLISREVTDVPGRSYFINNAVRTFDTRLVRSTFGTTVTEAFPTSVNFGDPNDQNGWVNVNATVDITANYVYEYYFDATTGMIVEIGEDSSYSFDLNYFNSSTPNLQPGGGPLTYSIGLTMSINGARSSLQTINEASSFYGNTRPVTSGTNRIEEGHLLVYDSESENVFSFDSDMVVGDPLTTGWESYDSNWGWSDAYGTANFDVYRHRPGSFDTVMFMEGTREGEWGYDNSGTHQGQFYSDTNTSALGPENYIDWDYMNFLSTADEEIQHFFDPNMHFNDDFLYDDKDGGDGWRLNYPRDVPQSGIVNDTAFHIDLPTDEIFQINGFDRTWFDVQMYGQNYERSYNQVVEIPVFRDDNGEAWMNVTLSGVAHGSQDFFYDANTGVLIRMEQRIEVYLTLDGTQGITFDVYVEGLEPATITVTADFFAEITISEKFSIMLSEHPVEYLSAEGTDPVDHLTDTTTTSTTSTTSTTTVDTITSSTTSSTDDGGNGDLPIPVSIVPVLSALTVVAIYVRKRKY